ncbi:hypothetical protein AB0N92_27770 [Streptomyces sp. NPDC093248]|uniref:hypothetical protein n=1 Tax=Streptomyces sp. NPDC093248 TaxID=3155072 RepID=UPI003435DDBB
MSHVRTMVWGPAEFVGLPPGRIVVEGMLAGAFASAAIVGAAVFGAWTGRPSLADGEAGLVCAAALTLYLTSVGAGRALVGITALLGVCLALQAPPAAVGVVLAERGRVESAVVTSVGEGASSDGGHGRYLCSVMDRDGVSFKVRIWRGCGATTRPGDVLAIVHDPEGRVPPRGVATGAGPLWDLAPWSVALMVASATAVVRSYRLSCSSEVPRHGSRHVPGP